MKVKYPFWHPMSGLRGGIACGLIVFILLMVAQVLVGCSSLTPYVAYRHQSDPSLEDDGRDLGCAGIKKRGRLSVSAGWCLDRDGEDMAEFEIEYELRKEK